MISTDLETWLLYCVLIRKDQNSIEKLKQKVTYSSEKKKPTTKGIKKTNTPSRVSEMNTKFTTDLHWKTIMQRDIQQGKSTSLFHTFKEHLWYQDLIISTVVQQHSFPFSSKLLTLNSAEKTEPDWCSLLLLLTCYNTSCRHNRCHKAWQSQPVGT